MSLRDSLLISIWHYLRVFEKFIGKKIYLIFSFSFLAATAESIGLLLLIPLLQSLGDKKIETTNFLSRLLNFKEFSGPVEILLYVFLAFLIKAIFTFIAYSYLANIRADLLGKMKKNIFKKYANANYKYFEFSDIGYLSSVINFQVRAMMQSFYFVSSVIVQLLNAGLLILIAYSLGPIQAILALIGGVLIFSGFYSINKYIKKQSIIYANTEAKSSSYVNQFLNSFKYLKSTNQNSFFEVPFNKAANNLIFRQKNIGIANSLTTAIRDPLAILVIFFMVLVQVNLLGLPAAPVFVSIILFYRALNSIIGTQINWQQAMEFIGSLEIIDDENKKLEKNLEKNGQIFIKDFKKGILFKEVGLKLEKKQKNILNGITLYIPKNATIAIVGPSGAGKTTIIDLLTLNRIPTEGYLYIDKFNSLDINKNSWRNLIGYVQQENTIFDCSIRQNITMISQEQNNQKNLNKRIISAAKAANIHDFIQSLPEGYSTPAGDKGIKLSGGQRQRICLAREIFRRPKIMLLDEATSALDIKNEKIIQKSIENLKGKQTTILITHRLSLIKFCDYIYVIDKGKIIEEGQYNYLISKKNSYLNIDKNILT